MSLAFSTCPIVIHAGFHKTGTSFVQETLRANRSALKAHCAVALKPRLQPILRAARAYSMWRDPITLATFGDRLGRWLAEMPDFRKRALIVSAEELSGHLPGRDDLTDFNAAIDLAGEIRDAFRRRFGEPDLRFVYTTREMTTWMESAYWEHVKSSSMTQTPDQFYERCRDAADFDPVIDRIRASVTPSPVSDCRLEHCSGDPLGPAGNVLRAADLPEDLLAELVPAPVTNSRLPEQVLNELLDLNRNIGDREARRQAKKEVLARYRKEQERT